MPITIFEKLSLDSKDFSYCKAVCRAWRQTIGRSNNITNFINRHIINAYDLPMFVNAIGRVDNEMSEDSAAFILCQYHINLKDVFGIRFYHISECFFYNSISTPRYTILKDVQSHDMIVLFDLRPNDVFKDYLISKIEELFYHGIIWKDIRHTQTHLTMLGDKEYLFTTRRLFLIRFKNENPKKIRTRLRQSTQEDIFNKLRRL